MNDIILHRAFDGPRTPGAYSAEAMTYMFFGPGIRGSIHTPNKLVTAFKSIVSGLDRTPDKDSLAIARQAMEEHGFEPRQIGSFMGVVQQAAGELVHEYGQLIYGPEYDTYQHHLDLYYSEDFFMGVKIEGERLDQYYFAHDKVFKTVERGMNRLQRDFPSLFVPAATAPRPHGQTGSQPAPRA